MGGFLWVVSIRTHCYIWRPIMGPTDLLFVWSEVSGHVFHKRRVNVMVRCLVVMMLTQIVYLEPGFDPPLRHRVFLYIETDCYREMRLRDEIEK